MQNADFDYELTKARIAHSTPRSSATTSAYFEYKDGGHRAQVPVYRLPETPRRSKIEGPAILVDKTQTIVVEPDCHAYVLRNHVILEVGDSRPIQSANNADEIVSDPVSLAVFANRFMR